ncbi:regulator of chromosome condensation 1/beta-lactamase-inhibitor protein II [Aspergillus bertholletiae]|uniref:Regulator of chromosome condensation 1/beta-lactamase-inhibitor protein II n=1 Tax=Aspergillus bertholletiae TaxID=1226010 RepID=A0A5N7ASA3_9EURO|nr:regulator of chromosome condensation 1/beta-lactamase-inhibitor protein II [Aspergillus bertholletiae]
MPLYAFGSNGSGQLGIGHDEDVSIPTRCIFEAPEPEILLQSSEGQGEGEGHSTNCLLQRIAAGGNHTLLLFSSGAVYAAGCNDDGRCGVVEEEPGDHHHHSLTRFRRVVVADDGTGQSCATFRDVSACWEGTFLVAAEGDRVFVVGSGPKGELGLGEGVVRAARPTPMKGFPPSGTQIVSVASGMGHTVAVLSDGSVYGWGAARKGQLGEVVKGRKMAWEPVRVDGVPFSRATGAVCGREFTVVTGDKGEGEFVILGSADNRWNVLSDAPPTLGVYRDIGASWHGVYVQRDEGVLTWGRNDRGQLPPVDLPAVRELAVGSEHGLALLGGGTVAAFGWGEHGNCGPVADEQGNVKGKYGLIPLPMEGGSRVVGVGAGCATSWVIMS